MYNTHAHTPFLANVRLLMGLELPVHTPCSGVELHRQSTETREVGDQNNTRPQIRAVSAGKKKGGGERGEIPQESDTSVQTHKVTEAAMC